MNTIRRIILTMPFIAVITQHSIYSAAEANPAVAQPGPTYEEQLAKLQQQIFDGIDLCEKANPQVLDAALSSLFILQNNAKKPGDFNFRNKDGYTPLHYAATKVDGGISCQRLLWRTADTEVRHPDSLETPLLVAIRLRNTPVMMHLLNKKANVEATNDKGDSALAMAIQAECPGAAHVLIMHGADHTKKNKDGVALFDTAGVGVRSFIQKAIIDRHGPALFAAIKQNDRQAFTTSLAFLSSFEFTNQQGETPLLCAATSDSSLYAHSLLQKKADVNACHANGLGTPLLVALKRPYSADLWPLISTLMPARVDIEAADSSGKTALMLAAEQVPIDDNLSSLNALRCLIQRDASNAVRDKDGNNALLLAVKKNDVRVADALLNYAESMLKFDLQNGARKHINMTNNEGECALGIAIKNGNADMVKLLIIAGAEADVAAPHLVGVTLAEIASPELQHVIRDAEPEHLIACERTSILHAQFLLRKGIIAGDRQLIDDALAQGAEINYVEKPGWPNSPLIEACYVDDSCAMIELLLERKADINQMEFDSGFTPLMHAIDKRQQKSIETLLAHKADVHRYSHTSPLHLAVEQSDFNLAQQLIALNAPVHTRYYPTEPRASRDKIGLTPLHRAVQQDNHALVELLIVAGASPHVAIEMLDSPLLIAQRKDAERAAGAAQPEAQGATLVGTIQAAVKKRKEIEGQVLLAKYHAKQAVVSPYAMAVARALAEAAEEKKEDEQKAGEVFVEAAAVPVLDENWLLISED